MSCSAAKLGSNSELGTRAFLPVLCSPSLCLQDVVTPYVMSVAAGMAYATATPSAFLGFLDFLAGPLQRVQKFDCREVKIGRQMVSLWKLGVLGDFGRTLLLVKHDGSTRGACSGQVLLEGWTQRQPSPQVA